MDHPSDSSPLAKVPVSFKNEPQPVNIERLVVLVPNFEMDEIAVARRVWELASPHRLGVLFIGLCNRVTEEGMLRRNLIKLSALTRDPYLMVETRLEFGKDWHGVLTSVLKAGDVLVFQSGKWFGLSGGAMERRLSNLGAPLWVLNGASSPAHPPHNKPLVEAGFWFVSLSIVVGFLVIQSRLLQFLGSWDLKILFSLSVLVEIVLLFYWHRLTS